MMMNYLVPMIAPVLGGQLLSFTSWRGVFVTLALIGMVIVLVAAFGLRETLPPAHRQSGGVSASLRDFRHLLLDGRFIGLALSLGFTFAAVFVYIASSPFILQNIYGLLPQRASFVYGINALGVPVMAQVNARLVGRMSPQKLLICGAALLAIGGLALISAVITGLAASGETRFMSVLNAGIGGNELLTTARISWAGEAAIHRFAWDVLEQAGTTDLIVLIGGNDLLNDTRGSAIIDGLQHLATLGREHHLRVFVSTILPGSYTPEQAEQRSLVNTWLREQGTRWFDGVFDFATSLGHPENETKLDPTYDSGDGLHPNDTGYQRMAEAVDLTQLTDSPSL
jgi:lysophospholipase L1-like esterase